MRRTLLCLVFLISQVVFSGTPENVLTVKETDSTQKSKSEIYSGKRQIPASIAISELPTTTKSSKRIIKSIK